MPKNPIFSEMDRKGPEIENGTVKVHPQVRKIMSESGPVAVVAHTKKGAGISFMEGKFEWHGKAPNDEQFKQAMAELQGAQ